MTSHRAARDLRTYYGTMRLDGGAVTFRLFASRVSWLPLYALYEMTDSVVERFV